MADATPALSIHQVNVGYGKKIVVHGVTLEIQQGEIFGLIGLNGTGKTTLIKSIVALRKAEEGNIQINGFDLDDEKSRHHFSYLPERFDPPWFLTGAEFVRFSLNLYGRSITHAEMEQAADGIDLAREALDRRVQTYSKGMRQKLGLLSTFLSGCPLLILDEPMSGLDPQARYHVKSMIEAAKIEGRSVFLSSHILSDMGQICDRVAVMHEGILRFCGKPDEMLKQAGNDNMEEAFLKLIKVAV